MELLAAHFAQWACSTAFPEMMHLPLQQLRRFAKQCKVERFRSSAKALAAALEANIAYVAAHRASDAFAPKDTASVLRFLATDDALQKVRALSCAIHWVLVVTLYTWPAHYGSVTCACCRTLCLVKCDFQHCHGAAECDLF